MSRTLHQVYLMVTDVDESVAFYRDGLGLEPADLRPGRAKFDTGACTLVLEADFDEAVLDQFGLEPPGDDRGSGVVTVVEVSDIDAVAAQLDDFGADILSGPQTVEWGRELLLVADPDGYVIEVSRPLEE